MNGRDEAVSAYLPPDTVLGQIEAAVVVADQQSNLLYANAYAARLFDFPDAPERLVGRSLLSLGFEEEDLGKAADLAKQVLRGRAWDGTFSSVRPGGSRVFIRAQAVPLRGPSGAIDGIVIVGRQATRLSSQQERDRIGLLERIGERLARSLELGITLRHVAEALVPQLADHCFIDLFQGDKLFRRAQINAGGWEPAPGTWAAVGEQISYPEGHFCQQAMARRDPVLVSNLVYTEFPAPNAQSMRASEDVGLISIVAAPLVARGELLGVISLALSRLTEREEFHYDIDDRDFLGAVASRVAVAIDNAMLFEEERRTALAFQTSLLPQVKPTFDGLDVAWRYVPAKPLETHGQGIQTQVGGDWYDLIPLSAGRVGIVIGDVEGRGARAAAIMGQLRATLRAFAQDDKAPAEILRKLDDWCRTLSTPPSGDGEHFDSPRASCTYLVYDAWSRSLSFANAGHDAPLVVTDGDVADLDIEHHGVLLGVRGTGVAGLPTYREETRTLKPGTTLVLYTDGLTDRRQRADGSGHYTEAEARQMLCAAVRGVAGSPAEVIAQAAENAVPGDIDDDMAIVVVSTSREDLASWEATFPAEADPGLRGAPPRTAHLRTLGPAAGTDRTRLPAGFRGGHERRAAHRCRGAAPSPDDAGARWRARRPAARSGRRGRPGGVGLRRVRRRVPRTAHADIHAAPAARGVDGVGRGVRRRPAAAADSQRGGDRRGRARPVPGGSARHPVGVPADQGWQGSVVRGAGRPRAGTLGLTDAVRPGQCLAWTPTAAAG